MSFKITILGSSGALPAFGRFPSAQAIEIQNRNFLVDCGEGAQMRLIQYQANLHRINHVFISHLHGDHFLGLMGLIFSMHLMRRTNDLHIYAHKGLDDIITTQLRHSRSAPHFRIEFHPLKDNSRDIIFEDEVLTVETIPLDHRIPCTGFLFREKEKPRRIDKERLPPGLKIQQIANLKNGADVLDDSGNVVYRNADLTIDPKHSRSYAYCSDTAWQPAMVEQLKGIDVLYHEATFLKDEAAKAEETRHSTAQQAATIARDAHVKQLILGHFSARYRELEPILEEAKAIFDNTHLAIEGTSFTIEES